MAISLKNVARKIWLDAQRLTGTTCFERVESLLAATQRFRGAIEARETAAASIAMADIRTELGTSPWESRYRALATLIRQYPTREAYETAVLESVGRFNEHEVLTKQLRKNTNRIVLRVRTNDIIQPIPEEWHAETKRMFGDVPTVTNLGKIDILLDLVYSTGLGLASNWPLMRYVVGTGDGRVGVNGRPYRDTPPHPVRDYVPHYHSSHHAAVADHGDWWLNCLGDFENLIRDHCNAVDIPRLLSVSLDYLHSWGPHGGEAAEHPWQITRGVCSMPNYRLVDQYCVKGCGAGTNRIDGFCETCGTVGCDDAAHDDTRMCTRCELAHRCPECQTLRTTRHMPNFVCYGPCRRTGLCMAHCADQNTWFCRRCEDTRLAAIEATRVANEKIANENLAMLKAEAVELKKKSPKPKRATRLKASPKRKPRKLIPTAAVAGS